MKRAERAAAGDSDHSVLAGIAWIPVASLWFGYGFGAITSTRNPCSSAVLAVAGPITAMIVEAELWAVCSC